MIQVRKPVSISNVPSTAHNLQRFLFQRAPSELHQLLGILPDSFFYIKSAQPWEKGPVQYVLGRKGNVHTNDVPEEINVTFDRDAGIVQMLSTFADGAKSKLIANKVREHYFIVRKQIVEPQESSRKITLHRVDRQGVKTWDLDAKQIAQYVTHENEEGPIQLTDLDELLGSLED